MTVPEAMAAAAGWLWTHGPVLFPLSLAAVALIAGVRLAAVVAVFVADLRLRWRAGSALGRGGLVDRFVDASSVSGDPMAHGRGQHSLFYTVYLQSDAWRTRRARTLMLAGGACQRCGAKATDAHHATYDRLGQEADNDLLALCQPCHRAAHGRTPS